MATTTFASYVHSITAIGVLHQPFLKLLYRLFALFIASHRRTYVYSPTLIQKFCLSVCLSVRPSHAGIVLKVICNGFSEN